MAEVVGTGDVSALNTELYATGFFVSVPPPPESRGPQGNYTYFVTAWHVAKDLQQRQVAFVVNKQGGGVAVIQSNIIPMFWVRHPADLTADIAITPFNNTRGLDVLTVPQDEFLTPESIPQLGVGIGDEVFMTGLFTEAPGQKQIMPIVRHGNIAMMPIEQIQTELGYADVYLIEARSIGGISGSPVFVRQTISRRVFVNGEPTFTFSLGPFKLLGVAQGHWDIKESEMNKAVITHDRKRGVNLGIATITPAYKILETLNHPTLVMLREHAQARYR